MRAQDVHHEQAQHQTRVGGNNRESKVLWDPHPRKGKRSDRQPTGKGGRGKGERGFSVLQGRLMVTAGPMASDGVATEESSRAPSSKFVHHRQQKFEVVQRDSWGGKPRHLVGEGGKGKNGKFGRKGGNQKLGGEASNSNGWLGGARGERHPQSGETRHCRFGTHCKYMHKYCPFVHVHTVGGKGQASPTKVENYWSALRGRDERNSLRPKKDSHSTQRGRGLPSDWVFRVWPRPPNPLPTGCLKNVYAWVPSTIDDWVFHHGS